MFFTVFKVENLCLCSVVTGWGINPYRDLLTFDISDATGCGTRHSLQQIVDMFYMWELFDVRQEYAQGARPQSQESLQVRVLSQI